MVPHAGRVLAGGQGLVRTVVLGLGVDEAGRVLVEGRHELAQASALLQVQRLGCVLVPLINIGN